MPRKSLTSVTRDNFIEILEGFNLEKDPSILADEILPKFKWIARSVSPYIDIQRVIIAHIPRDEHPATDAEKNQYAKIISLHSDLPEIFRLAADDEDVADALASIIDFHIGEAKNSDTNTIKYSIISFIPLDPKTDVINPPITGSGKDNRGFNHLVTGAALCPLKDQEKYKRNPLAYCDKVNAGQTIVSDRDYATFFYPTGTSHDPENIDKDLFRGHILIRTLRSLYAGKNAGLEGKRTAPKMSQAEMHGMVSVTPEAVACAAIHSHFGMTSLENWSHAPAESFNYPRFFKKVLSLFQDPRDPWVIDTLSFLTKQLPTLRSRKRRLAEIDDDEDGEPDETEVILQRRAARLLAAENNVRAMTPIREQDRPPSPPQSSPPQQPTSPPSPVQPPRPQPSPHQSQHPPPCLTTGLSPLSNISNSPGVRGRSSRNVPASRISQESDDEAGPSTTQTRPLHIRLPVTAPKKATRGHKNRY